MRRGALLALLPLALLLIPAPGASAATCTATTGAWSTGSTWSCPGHTVPEASDTVVIPAGKTVSLLDDDTENAAGLTLRGGGALVLGDNSELDVTGFAVSGGGSVSGPQYATLEVTLGEGVQATVDSAGLTVTGAYVNVTGDGAFGVTGPLVLTNGGWIESDVETSWTGSTPWQIGGGAGVPPDPPPTSGFEMVGAQLTTTGATSVQGVASGGDGVIQLDGGATIYKQDASTTTIGIGVLLDTAEVHVVSGKLIGEFQGQGELDVAAGATLGLAGSGLQLTPPTANLRGGTLEAEAGADVAIDFPAPPGLHQVTVAAGASLDVDVGATAGPVDSSVPDAVADAFAVGSGATLSVADGGGTLALAAGGTLGGSGTLDGSLQNAGTVTPNGALHLTGDYTQTAGGTLALDLRSASDGDSLQVDGAVALAGTLHVTTAYAPASTATPLVLAATDKPTGAFAKTIAPLSSGHAWTPSYSAMGVALAVGNANGSKAPESVTVPSLRPAVPVVGGRTRCLPGSWKGAHALAYAWLRGGKPIAHAKAARYRISAADRGRRLACRVTATAKDGAKATATSKRSRARVGLRVVKLSHAAGELSVSLSCARSERRCAGSLRVLFAGHLVAHGRFALHSPGGIVRLALAGEPPSGLAMVRTSYRNAAGAARVVQRSLALDG